MVWESGRSTTCLHTGNILRRVAKCATGRKCYVGRVCEKDDHCKYSTLSATHMFFFVGGRDSWSLVRRGSQPHCRNRQKSQAFAQPISAKHRSCSTCTNAFQWQFSVSMPFALPTRSQFPSLHRNHYGHNFLLLLI